MMIEDVAKNKTVFSLLPVKRSYLRLLVFMVLFWVSTDECVKFFKNLIGHDMDTNKIYNIHTKLKKSLVGE